MRLECMGMSVAISPLQELRAALYSGEITPRAAVEQALARANSNSGRNVYIAMNAEAALREAEQLPRRFPSSAKPPLYGLPVSLKDCFGLAGFVTTDGTHYYAERNAPAPEDSAVAARLRSQGAIIVGKTHMHPLAYGITGENPDYGDCRQPRNSALLTGGSSSGAAASVQEGSAVAAIGTDTGGSIRAPAALCGLTGYRASIELATNSPVASRPPTNSPVGAGLAPPGVNFKHNLWRGAVHLAPSFDTLGWLFRDLRDGPLLGEALFGLEVPASSELQVRIGVVANQFLQDCEPQILNAFTQWQERQSELGAALTPIDTTYWEDAMTIYAPIQASEAAAIHTATTRGDFSHFEPTIAQRLTWGASIPPSELHEFRQSHATFREKTDALFRNHDFLILPCAPTAQLAAGADHTNTRKAILRYTTPFSLAGVPVVTLPAQGGAGVQLAAARGADAQLLAYAAQLGAPVDT
jgi:aspartyl-tRNA(Asn)/glutamyl-tRNA(Gln) amidotransferase subunit A